MGPEPGRGLRGRPAVAARLPLHPSRLPRHGGRLLTRGRSSPPTTRWRVATTWGSGWGTNSRRSPRSTATSRPTPCPTGA
eukprot:10763655-Alexandrium_andersonii.AAC.1